MRSFFSVAFVHVEAKCKCIDCLKQFYGSSVSLLFSNFNLICLLPDITTGFRTASVYRDSGSSACDAVQLNYTFIITCHDTEDLILQ
jgi:hypothetical protein